MVSVAPVDCVIAVYGNGVLLVKVVCLPPLVGAIVFKNDFSGECFVGVWGARNASRFRNDLRAHMQIVVHKKAPDAQFTFEITVNERPKKSARK